MHLAGHNSLFETMNTIVMQRLITFRFVSKLEYQINVCNYFHGFIKGLFLKGDNLGSDTVQITTALRGESASTIRVLLDELQGFQRLESFPGNGA